jgi:hypothetical protein
MKHQSWMYIVIFDETWFSPCRLIQTFYDENAIQMAAHPPFTGFGTLGLLGLRGSQETVEKTVIRNRRRIFRRSLIDFERIQSGDIAIGFS